VRRGALMPTSAKRRPAARAQRLALSSISASEANTPRRRDAVETKLWNMLPGECRYTVADSPHLKLLCPSDGDGLSTPRTAENASPPPSGTTPQPADLSHVPVMSHHATGFLDGAEAESQPSQPEVPPQPTASTMPLLTPDARLQRRRKALASGSFKDGAGALFSNTAHLDLELLCAPGPAALPASSRPIGGVLGVVACVCLGMLLHLMLAMKWPQTMPPQPWVAPPAEAAQPPAPASASSSDRHQSDTVPTWVATRDPMGVCAAPAEVQVEPAPVAVHSCKSAFPWDPVLAERAVVQAAAYEWSLLEISRLSARVSQAERERDSLRRKMAEHLELLETVLALEMKEHRARTTLEQDVDWFEAELDALSQSEEDSW
jgi:hypothetical protein